MTTETSKYRCGSLAVTDFPYFQPQYFFLWLLFSSLMVEKKKNNTTNVHTVKIAECLLLFHSQFDGENMYMSMTEPSQDYVPASQVG